LIGSRIWVARKRLNGTALGPVKNGDTLSALAASRQSAKSGRPAAMPGMFSRRGIVPIEAAAPATPVAVFCFGAFFFAAFFFTSFFPRSFFFAGFFFAAFLFAAFFFAFLAISQPINAV